MAIGIFGLAALQRFAVAPALTLPLTLGLLVLWTALAASYFASYVDGRFAVHLASPVRRFAVGTWVAATAVLARLVLFGIPEWRSLGLMLVGLAAVIWLGFLVLAARTVRDIVARSAVAVVPGVILLSTVGTQAVSLAVLDFFPAQAAWRSVAVVLIALGGVFYLAGAAVVVRSHARRSWSLKDDWDNTNCVLHGALSITGLALVLSGAAVQEATLGLWLCVLGIFVAVETIEAARLVLRVRAYGWRRGVFTYDVTQWSRNFTFGMFYAFTLALAGQTGSHTRLDTVLSAVLAWGHYVVLLLLLVEILVYLNDRFVTRARPTAGTTATAI